MTGPILPAPQLHTGENSQEHVAHRLACVSLNTRGYRCVTCMWNSEPVKLPCVSYLVPGQVFLPLLLNVWEETGRKRWKVKSDTFIHAKLERKTWSSVTHEPCTSSFIHTCTCTCTCALMLWCMWMHKWVHKLESQLWLWPCGVLFTLPPEGACDILLS